MSLNRKIWMVMKKIEKGENTDVKKENKSLQMTIKETEESKKWKKK